MLEMSLNGAKISFQSTTRGTVCPVIYEVSRPHTNDTAIAATPFVYKAGRLVFFLAAALGYPCLRPPPC